MSSAKAESQSADLCVNSFKSFMLIRTHVLFTPLVHMVLHVQTVNKKVGSGENPLQPADFCAGKPLQVVNIPVYILKMTA